MDNTSFVLLPPRQNVYRNRVCNYSNTNGENSSFHTRNFKHSLTKYISFNIYHYHANDCSNLVVITGFRALSISASIRLISFSVIYKEFRTEPCL